MPIDLGWMRFLATRADEQKSMQRELLQVMRSLFGENMLRAVLRDSAEIDNASARMMSVYELEQPVTSRENLSKMPHLPQRGERRDRDANPVDLAFSQGRLQTEGVL